MKTSTLALLGLVAVLMARERNPAPISAVAVAQAANTPAPLVAPAPSIPPIIAAPSLTPEYMYQGYEFNQDVGGYSGA